MLLPGPGAITVLIGGKPAWRGVGAAAVAGLMAAKTASDVRVTASLATRTAAMGTPGAPAAIVADEALKAAEAASMSATITSSAGGADIHMCVSAAPVPLPPPPHGAGVVIDGSTGVFINGLPACRMGDTILEAFGPPDKILMGLPTVIIGEVKSGDASMSSSQVEGVPAGASPTTVAPPSAQVEVMAGASASGTPFCEVCGS